MQLPEADIEAIDSLPRLEELESSSKGDLKVHLVEVVHQYATDKVLSLIM